MIRNIIFDVGNVLIDWDIWNALGSEFEDRAQLKNWLETSDFMSFNENIDLGEPREALYRIAEEDYPDQARLFKLYVERCLDSLPALIDGTWALKNRLKDKGYGIYALSNFGQFPWEGAAEKFPAMVDAFDDKVVSGYVGLIKPDPAIFYKLLDQIGATPESCFFIDDSHKNIVAADALGIHTHEFTTPDRLEADLVKRGLL